MIPIWTASRAWWVIRKGLVLIVPPLVTLVLFLILYNNLYCGRVTAIVMILLNMAVILVPARWCRAVETLSNAKASCLCIAAALVTLLTLEFLFPVCLPKEYARIRDLSKGPGGPPRDDRPWFSVVFTNGDQKIWLPASTRAVVKGSFAVWHVPGKQLEYYGYDPNDKFNYVNIVQWNSHGYFDHDYDYRKAPGVSRIVFVGDSYVEATQVPLTRTFHKLLERSLNERPETASTTSQRFEVVALGHSGAGQKENLSVLENEAVLYGPDIVAVTLCYNDFCDDDPALRKERALATGDITPEFRNLVRHGYLAPAFVLRRFHEWQMSRIRVSPEVLQWSGRDIPRIEAAWDYSLGMIRRASDLCRSRGIQFVLVYLGSEPEMNYLLNSTAAIAQMSRIHGLRRDFHWNMGKSINRVRQYCQKHHIPMISLLEPLAVYQRKTGKLVFGDHYTMFGHEVAARVLEAGLRSTVLRPPVHEARFQPQVP